MQNTSNIVKLNVERTATTELHSHRHGNYTEYNENITGVFSKVCQCRSIIYIIIIQ